MRRVGWASVSHACRAAYLASTDKEPRFGQLELRGMRGRCQPPPSFVRRNDGLTVRVARAASPAEMRCRAWRAAICARRRRSSKGPVVDSLRALREPWPVRPAGAPSRRDIHTLERQRRLEPLFAGGIEVPCRPQRAIALEPGR